MRRLGREERRALTVLLFAAASLALATPIRELWLIDRWSWWTFAVVWLLVALGGVWLAAGRWDDE